MTKHLLTHKKTKILATIGPATENKETFIKLVKAGLSAVRLNFSHGTHEEHAARIAMIREVEKELNLFIPIVQDLQGPKIRLGKMEGKRQLNIGDTVVLEHADEQASETIPVAIDIFPALEVGHRIFINDGIVQVKVLSLTKTTATCEVMAPGEISSRKGLNLPDTKLPSMALTPKDKEDLAFGLSQGVDYVALSFVQDEADILYLRDIINAHTHHPKIIVKVETASAIRHLKKIIEVTDVVMIARGDLAVEVGQEEVPLLQREMIELARENSKPVIVATQMLESMNVNAQPTRAEVNDVATAVLDHVDAVMLSAETASGNFPIETVTMMNKIIQRVETFHEAQHHKHLDTIKIDETKDKTLAIASGASLLARKLDGKLICAVTRSGRTAITISSYRPACPIVAICDSVTTARQLSLVWGIVSFQVIKFVDTHSQIYQTLLNDVKEEYKLQNDDIIILVSGTHLGKEGHTNTIHVITAETKL